MPSLCCTARGRVRPPYSICRVWRSLLLVVHHACNRETKTFGATRDLILHTHDSLHIHARRIQARHADTHLEPTADPVVEQGPITNKKQPRQSTANTNSVRDSVGWQTSSIVNMTCEYIPLRVLGLLRNVLRSKNVKSINCDHVQAFAGVFFSAGEASATFLCRPDRRNE